MNEALSPSMNVLPTPSVTQLLYSLVVSSDFSAGFSAFLSSAGLAAVDYCAARGPGQIKHAPAIRVTAWAVCERQFFSPEVDFIRGPVGCWQGLIAHRGPDLRTVHGFVATAAPTRAAAEERRMVLSADNNASGRSLLLEMAFETERLIAGDQHFLVHRTMHPMAGGASFAQRFMFEHKRAELHGMALAAGFIFPQ